MNIELWAYVGSFVVEIALHISFTLSLSLKWACTVSVSFNFNMKDVIMANLCVLIQWGVLSGGLV